MRQSQIYDAPTRLFHWLFSGFFLISFVIAKTVDDESLVFSFHMISGMLLGVAVLFRIIWGFFGTEHARFSNFVLSPKLLKDYFAGILSCSKNRWVGHNPASSWAAIAMFGLTIGLVVTGYLMSTGQKKAFEDIHEIFAHSFIVIVIAHIAGIVLHTIKHKDDIGLSMLDGKKMTSTPVPSLSSNRYGVAILFLCAIVGSGFYLIQNFDVQTRKLSALGLTLQLGEDEKAENDESDEHDSHESDAQKGESQKEDHDDDDDDDDD